MIRKYIYIEVMTAAPKALKHLALFLLLSCASFAEPRVKLESDRIVLNDSVNVSVHMYNIHNAGAISLKILFDAARIRPGRVVKVNPKIDDALIVWDAASLSVAWERLAGVQLDDDVIIEFRFYYNGQNTALAFDTARCEIADSSARILLVKYNNLSLPASSAKMYVPAPVSFSMKQNYPNPCNAVSKIRFTVSKTTALVFDVLTAEGEFVARPFNRIFAPGEYVFSLNLEDLGLGSGVYFYTMRAPHESITKKLIYLK